MSVDFSGVITAIVTPFKQGELDKNSFCQLVDEQLACGIEGFVVGGTTGESPTLKEEEVFKLFNWAKDRVRNRVPLIVGTGVNCTRTTIEKTLRAKEWGADAALVVTPYYNKPTQKGLRAHYKEIAHHADIPLILYNVPSRTGVSLSVQTISELSEIPQIVGIKEASGDLKLGKDIMESCGEFLLTSGDDKTCMTLMSLGGHGVISVFSHLFPKMMVSFSQKIKSGQKEVLKEYEKFYDLIDFLFHQPNPIPVKKVLKKMGLISSAELRLPLMEMTDEELDPIEGLLERMKKVYS
jgi:4-hydroxy-tetrahydrodipicolinate synthase